MGWMINNQPSALYARILGLSQGPFATSPVSQGSNTSIFQWWLYNVTYTYIYTYIYILYIYLYIHSQWVTGCNLHIPTLGEMNMHVGLYHWPVDATGFPVPRLVIGVFEGGFFRGEWLGGPAESRHQGRGTNGEGGAEKAKDRIKRI